MNNIQEQINELKNLRKITNDKDTKDVIDKIILQKQETEDIEKSVDEFVQNFMKDMEIKTNIEVEKTPVLEKMYNELIQNYCTPNESFLKNQKVINDLKNLLDNTLDKNQKILLRELTFCYYNLQSNATLEAFIYGYAMSSQLNEESVSKYHRK